MFPFQPHEYTTCAVICKPLVAKERVLNGIFALTEIPAKYILVMLCFGKIT